MHLSYKSLRPKQKKLNLFFFMPDASSLKEMPCPLNAAQHVAPDLPLTDSSTLRSPSASMGIRSVSSGHMCGMPIAAAQLSAKTYNALLNGRITTVEQLCTLELCDLRWLRNFGKKAVNEVVAYRAHLGVPLVSEK